MVAVSQFFCRDQQAEARSVAHICVFEMFPSVFEEVAGSRVWPPLRQLHVRKVREASRPYTLVYKQYATSDLQRD